MWAYFHCINGRGNILGSVCAPRDKQRRAFVHPWAHCAPLLELYTMVHNSVYISFLSPPVQIAQWALMHCFLYVVCLSVACLYPEGVREYIGCTTNSTPQRGLGVLLKCTFLMPGVPFDKSTCHFLVKFKLHLCHSKKNSYQQMSNVLLLLQVGLIANVKLHFFRNSEVTVAK